METIPEDGSDIERAAFIPETIELGNAEEIFNTMN